MIKKLMLVMVAFVALIAQAQLLEFENGKVNKFWAPHSGYTDCHVPFTNKTGGTARFVYEKILVDWPSKWTATVCDNINCFATFNNRDSFASVGDNVKTEFKYTVFPSGHADTGVLIYSIYKAGDPGVRDTFTVYIYVPWGADVKSVKTDQIQIYPNPAAETIQLLSQSTGVFEISNIQGITLIKNKIESGNNTVNIATLKSGVYFISMNTSEGILRKQFVKI